MTDDAGQISVCPASDRNKIDVSDAISSMESLFHIVGTGSFHFVCKALTEVA